VRQQHRLVCLAVLALFGLAVLFGVSACGAGSGLESDSGQAKASERFAARRTVRIEMTAIPKAQTAVDTIVCEGAVDYENDRARMICDLGALGRTETITMGRANVVLDNLVEAGFEVVGYNRSPDPARRLEERGGRGADSLAAAVAEAEVVVTMLPDSPDVEAVALGDDGIYARARPGALHLDMSTIRPDVARRLAAAGVDVALRRGRLRVSPHLYNTEADIDRALEVLDGADRGRP
jgi:hypothetical protein